jgi:hypothetical protein
MPTKFKLFPRCLAYYFILQSLKSHKTVKTKVFPFLGFLMKGFGSGTLLEPLINNAKLTPKDGVGAGGTESI